MLDFIAGPSPYASRHAPDALFGAITRFDAIYARQKSRNSAIEAGRARQEATIDTTFLGFTLISPGARRRADMDECRSCAALMPSITCVTPFVAFSPSFIFASARFYFMRHSRDTK